MEVYLILRYAVGLCLRFCQDFKNPDRNSSGAVRNFRTVNDPAYLRHSPVLVLMGFLMMMPMLRVLSSMAVSVQIFHIMVVILMRLIQNHVKIADVQPGFDHPADFYPKALHRETFQGLHKHLLIGPQIQKRSHCHIAAYPRAAFQI